MKKIPIGILDGGIEGINIFESLSSKYPNETFIYISDLENYPYEGKDDEVITSSVKKNVNKLLFCNVCAIIVVSSSIIEYCGEYLKTLSIPVISIVDTIIEYVNTNYEQKNMILVAKEYILKANLFQKNFKYNHLYNIPSDELEQLIYEKKTKTAKSFEKVREVFRNVINKQINVLVIVDAFLMNLSIEIHEFLEVDIIIDLSDILMEALKTKNIQLYTKRRGQKIIIGNLSKKEFSSRAYWLKPKYRYIMGDKLINEQNRAISKNNTRE